jgi:hypothetical protein
MIDVDDQLCAHRAKIEDTLQTYTIAAKPAMTQTLGSLSVSMTLCFETVVEVISASVSTLL